MHVLDLSNVSYVESTAMHIHHAAATLQSPSLLRPNPARALLHALLEYGMSSFVCNLSNVAARAVA
jgi:hypothetical protein